MLNLIQFEFMRNALLAGILASVACGIIGFFVVTKKIVSTSGAIAHCAFGGIGLGYFLRINPLLAVLPFTIFSALMMGFVIRKTKIPEDTVTGIFWAVCVALGLIFIEFTPGYAPDLFSYLFGNILAVPRSDLFLMVILDAFIVLTVLILYKGFLAICFDEEYAEILNLPVTFLYLVLLGLVALTVVVLIRIVGIILVIALLTLPTAISKKFTQNFKVMILFSVLFSLIFSFLGLFIAYYLNLPAGAVIILLMAVFFAIVNFFEKAKLKIS